MLATFDRILNALTFAVGGIAAISLGVAGILIMNVMLVAVSQRTAEIGLLKALGASRRQILLLILRCLLLTLIVMLLARPMWNDDPVPGGDTVYAIPEHPVEQIAPVDHLRRVLNDWVADAQSSGSGSRV